MDYSRHNTEKVRKHIRSNAAKARKKINFNVFRAVIYVFVVAAAVGVAAAYGGFKGVMDGAPTIKASSVMPSKVKSIMYYPDGKEAVELVGAQSNRTIISINDMPAILPEAFIAIEDERFFEHNGVDPQGIVRALILGIQSGNFSQGASTITQQLIKLTVFNGGGETDSVERFKRKFQEWYLAVQLEKELSKEEILEAYLNTINLGRGAYGVEAAAERYFNKPARQLTVSESAVLAAIAQSPTYNNPIDGQEANAARRAWTLKYMLNDGFIDQEAYDEAVADDPYSRIQEINDNMDTKETIYTWFEDACIDQVLSDLQEKLGYSREEAVNALYSGGLQIYMTQDTYLQSIVDKYYNDDSNFTKTEYLLSWALTYKDKDGNEVNVDQNSMQSYYGTDNCDLLYNDEEEAQEAVDYYKKNGLKVKKKNIIAETPLTLTVQAQSSFVLMEQKTGKVLAISGGRGKKIANRGFNRATDALRQPGSVFKPLAVFLPALDACGLTLASTKMDEPYTTPDGFEVFNTNANSYQGLSSMRDAIVYSMNVITTKWLVEDVTPALGIKYLKDLGLSTIDEVNDNFAPLGLGGIYNGVSNLELTAAYAAIANGGVYTAPIFYSKILDQDGNVLIDNVPEKRTVMRDSTAWLLTSALEDVVKKGTGTPARLSNSGIAVAGKTGTTNEYKDLWFVGFTPYYTAGVWLGYDNSISMRGRINYNYNEHKTLWKNIMNEVLEGKEDAEFEMPDTVVKATVCSKSGKLASSGCREVTEYFAKSEVPTDYCEDHTWIPVNICSECGLRATSQTPEEYVYTDYFSDYDEIPSGYCQHTSSDADDDEDADADDEDEDEEDDDDDGDDDDEDEDEEDDEEEADNFLDQWFNDW